MVDTLQRERLIEALIGTFKWLYAESTSLEMQKKKKILIREFDILWLWIMSFFFLIFLEMHEENIFNGEQYV